MRFRNPRSAVAPGPPRYGSPEYQQQAEDLIAVSAALTDRQKMTAEYWSGEPEGPVARCMQIAQFVSQRDHHTLDDDLKMFFALSNALFGASIAAWDAKREYDSVRPVTAIPFLSRGKTIRASGGPGRDATEIDGSQWIPYRSPTLPHAAMPGVRL